jgi:dTDP-4-dehydrorhamnose reductase
MRVLITGAEGQVGRELVARFERNGNHQVTATNRAILDLAKRDSVLSAITSVEPDIVVHAGAFTAVDLCESQADDAIAINSLGTRHVVDAASRCGARVLYVSTDYVFDGSKDEPYNEWDDPNPQSVYGRSKLGGERELRTGDTIVRTSWVFGRHGNNIVKTILRLAEGDGDLQFVDDQHGKPTSAQDLAGCIYYLAVSQLPGIFHVTNAGATTWYQFACDVLTAAGHDPNRVKPIKTADMDPPRPARRPVNSVLDNAALRLQGLPELPDHRAAMNRLVKELLAGQR